MPRRQVNLPAPAFVPAPARRSLRLGTNAKITSPPPREAVPAWDAGLQLSPVARRFALQAGARDLLHGVQLKGGQVWSGKVADQKSHRVCHCLRQVQDSEKPVVVRHHPETKSGSLGNLQTCASVWACPVCSAKVTERRRGELRDALVAARARGLSVVMITRTVSHYAFEHVAEVLSLLKKAMKRLNNGKAAQRRRARWGIVGTIRSLEITFGANGWHPHYHELLLVEPGYDLVALRAVYAAEWSAAVQFAGGRRLSHEHGLDAVDCDVRIAEYVAKWGVEPTWQEDAELTKAPSKLGKHGGRTPLQLLHDYVFENDFDAGRVWREYALAMHGSHQLQWSRGLKALLGVVQRDDAEIEQEITADAVTMGLLSLEQWRMICRRDLRARVVELAGEGDMGALYDWLQASGMSPDLAVLADRREHGWRVKHKNVREQTDAAICRQVDKTLEWASLYGWLPGGGAEKNSQAMLEGRKSQAYYNRIMRDSGRVTTRH